jgi:hypothetical protein
LGSVSAGTAGNPLESSSWLRGIRSSITRDGHSVADAADARRGDDPGIDADRPTAEKANEVPTRQAAIDCMVLLAGSAAVGRPVSHDLTSKNTHVVIHSHETQASVRAPRSSQ